MTTRWVGVDEAGYGPNLGPLVMTAVVAEGPADSPPDLWRDLASTVSRAGSRDGRLWVDDSKLVFKGRKGLDRLEAATLAALSEIGVEPPSSFSGLLGVLGVDDAELETWSTGEVAIPGAASAGSVSTAISRRPFSGAGWRLDSIRSVVVGPRRFNDGLDALGLKSAVHFAAFERLVRPIWDDFERSSVRGDKHGGRNFYGSPLRTAFPEARVVPIEEGPGRSRYAMDAPGRSMALELIPRADSVDGLVALASMVSKLVRERWMGVFNDYWAAVLPGIAPTAGYPVDAARFRREIEPYCLEKGFDPRIWWRAK